MIDLLGCSDEAKSPVSKGLYAVLPLTVSSLGVTLHIDLDEEDYWLEVEVDHSILALESALHRIQTLGLDLIPEDECPADVDANGAVRTYLYEVIS